MDEPARPRRRAAAPTPRFRLEDARPRRTYRSGSTGFRPAPGWLDEIRLGAAQPGQAARAFAFDQRRERLTQECRLLRRAGQTLRLSEQSIIKRNVVRMGVLVPARHGIVHLMMTQDVPTGRTRHRRAARPGNPRPCRAI